MARTSPVKLSLAATIGPAADLGAAIVVEAVNRASQPVTVIALARYFAIEIEDARGQFVRGIAGNAGALAMPRPTDYLTIAPGGKAMVLQAPVDRASSSPGDVTIGDVGFSGVSDQARLRITYHATDRVMPNLPRDKQASFFGGPVDVIVDRVPTTR